MVRVEIKWTERALGQLRDIGIYIALENPEAALDVVTRVQEAVDRIEMFPESGRSVPEFPRLPHREIVIPPCRVFYRVQNGVAYIVHVARSERLLRRSHLVAQQIESEN